MVQQRDGRRAMAIVRIAEAEIGEDGQADRGIYRLAGSSVADFDAVLAGPPGQRVTYPVSRRRAAVPVDAEPLF